jgi:hypothetical protein
VAFGSIAKKFRNLRDRIGWHFGGSATSLPDPLRDQATLLRDIRARLRKTEVQLRAKRSLKRTRRKKPKLRKNATTRRLQASRAIHPEQVVAPGGFKHREIEGLYVAIWNRVLRDISRAVVNRQTSNWREYFDALRNLICKVVTNSSLSENEKTELTRRLLERINKLEKFW